MLAHDCNNTGIHYCMLLLNVVTCTLTKHCVLVSSIIMETSLRLLAVVVWMFTHHVHARHCYNAIKEAVILTDLDNVHVCIYTTEDFCSVQADTPGSQQHTHSHCHSMVDQDS